MYSEFVAQARKRFHRIKKGARPVLVDRGDYRKTVVLAGTGRSGTTWVSDIINYANDFRYVFEPFHPEKSDIVRRFRLKQYLRPDNCERAFVEPARAILSGKVRNAWVDKFNRKMIARKRLVKDIRANLLLRWIKTHFPEIPIILLLRHPCAVAHSRVKLNAGTGHFPDDVEGFLAQDELMQDFLNPFKSEIQGAQSVFERQIFVWCIENYVPLKQFSSDEIHLAFYENFCTHPEQESDRLFSFLDMAYDERIAHALQKPSPVSWEKSAIHTGASLTENWKRYVTDEQAKRAIDILSLFGLERLYSQDPLPLVSGERNPFDKSHSRQE